MQTAYRVGGHVVVNVDRHWFQCTKCDAKLLSAMQFLTAECPNRKPVNGSIEATDGVR